MSKSGWDKLPKVLLEHKQQQQQNNIARLLGSDLQGIKSNSNESLYAAAKKAAGAAAGGGHGAFFNRWKNKSCTNLNPGQQSEAGRSTTTLDHKGSYLQKGRGPA